MKKEYTAPEFEYIAFQQEETIANGIGSDAVNDEELEW